MVAVITGVDIEELLQSNEAKKLGSIQPGTFSGKADENVKKNCGRSLITTLSVELLSWLNGFTG